MIVIFNYHQELYLYVFGLSTEKKNPGVYDRKQVFTILSSLSDRRKRKNSSYNEYFIDKLRSYR